MRRFAFERVRLVMAQGLGRRYFKAFVSGFFVAVPVTVTFLDQVACIARVEGASMQPSLNPEGKLGSDIVLLNRWSIRNYSVHRGDIVSLVCLRPYLTLLPEAKMSPLELCRTPQCCMIQNAAPNPGNRGMEPKILHQHFLLLPSSNLVCCRSKGTTGQMIRKIQCGGRKQQIRGRSHGCWSKMFCEEHSSSFAYMRNFSY
nr:mitochondrial inner membrane protease subunit 2 isoform X3 [Geotrypetes seraphini]XP_033813959.1 mitochondrial inner membrane protease subunit 2 isoform X3 [Geotrypetes seraphini]